MFYVKVSMYINQWDLWLD